MAEPTGKVYDQLLCFLSDALFQNPICSFMDEHCLIFDSSIEISAEHKTVHEKYKKLVDLILSGFCEDADLSLENAIADIHKMSETPDIKAVFQIVFDQIRAADNFDEFHSLMTKRNLLIQEQVLFLIIASTGFHPESLKPQAERSTDGDKASRMPAADSNEQQVLETIMRQSQAEYQEDERMRAKSQEELERVLALSANEASVLEEQRKLIEQDMRKLAISHSSPETNTLQRSSGSAAPSASVSTGALPASRTNPSKLTKSCESDLSSSSSSSSKKPVSSSEAASQWLQSAQTESDSQQGGNVNKLAASSGEELKARQAYLREQRDRLLAMKKAARSRQLGEPERSAARPQSSRVARLVMDKPEEVPSPTSKADDDKKLAMRRSLAEKLRREVIDKY